MIRYVAALTLLAAATACSTAPRPSAETPAPAKDEGGEKETVTPADSTSDTAASAKPATAESSKAEDAKAAVPTFDGMTCHRLGKRLVDRALSNGALSVFRVAPNDTLPVRDEPNKGAKAVGAFAHDADGLRAVGFVCAGADKAEWVHVRGGETKGWVNRDFLATAMAKRDATGQYAKLKAPSVKALVAAAFPELGKKSSDSEEATTSLVGMTESGNSASANVLRWGEPDDSVAGAQTWLTLTRAKGFWSVSKAHSATLCYRGATDRGCI